jgi:hypothetical protein
MRIMKPGLQRGIISRGMVSIREGICSTNILIYPMLNY